MQVSIVVPIYNASATIEKCLSSLLALDYDQSQIEILVVDNNSQDDSIEKCRRFPVKILKEERQGRSFARNRGALEARGELVAFIDADVYLEEKWLTCLVDYLQKYQLGAAQGQIIPCRLYGSQSLNRYRYQSVQQQTKNSFILLSLKVYESPMINSAACLYRRDVFFEVGGFDDALERHEDIDLSKRVFLCGHNLGASSGARAFAIYHGIGWMDYLKRSFDDGFYKVDYLRKWGQESKSKESFLIQGLNLSWHYLWSFLKTGNFFWPLSYLNLVINHIGKIVGFLDSKKSSMNFELIKKSGRGLVYIDDQVAFELDRQ